MGRNLGPLNIKDTYEGLVQLSGSGQFTDGSGSLISNVDISASYADTSGYSGTSGVSVSSSWADSSGYANTAGEGLANYEIGSYTAATGTLTFTRSNATQQNIVLTSVPYAEEAGTSGYSGTSGYAIQALTASYAEYASGSVDVNAVYTASVVDATITFEKGDTSTFPITVNNVVNASSASIANTSGYAVLALTSSHALYAEQAGTAATASYTPNALITASYSNPNLTFTKGDGSTFGVVISTDVPSLQNVTDVGNSTTNSITASGAFLNGDVAISGDLDVNGTITYISSSTLQIGDNVIEINYNRAAGNSGILTYDTTSPFTASLLWDATEDRWIAGAYGSEKTIILSSDTGSMTVLSASYASTASYLEGGVSLQTVLDTGNTATQDMTLNGALDVSGSVSFEGPLQGLLRDNDDINIVYDGVALNSSPNIFIGAYSGSSTLVAGSRNNIVIGSAGSYNSGKNRLLEIEADNNTIIGGYNNYMSGSRPSNSTILGGVGNTMNKLGTAPTSMYVNTIIGGASNDILAGGYNVILGGSGNDIDFGDVDTSPNYNIIGGGSSTNIIGGDYNGVIAGYNHDIIGGKQAVIIGGEANMISQSSAVDMDSVIVGGRNNTLYEHQRSVILGGDGLSTTKNDEVVAKNLTISGDIDGSNNLVVNGGTNIGIPSLNTMTGISGSGIFGGHDNNVSGNVNATLGGRYNTVSDNQGTNVAVGGEYHSVSGFRCGAYSGEGNTVSGTNVAALSGYGNTIGGTYSAFAGGNGNNIGGTSYFAGGLVDSQGSGYVYAMLGGARLNCQTDSTVLAGGEDNTSVSGHRKGAIIGGEFNTLNGSDTDKAVILGGDNNIINSGGISAAIVGGTLNTASADYSAIVGGTSNNIVTGSDHGILAGYDNTITSEGKGSAIVGGTSNTINHTAVNAFGDNMTIIGGLNVTLSGANINETTAVGCRNHTIGGQYNKSFGANGGSNSAGFGNTIVGGTNGSITNNAFNTIVGGTGNSMGANAAYNIVLGGSGNNMASGASSYNAMIGGQSNVINGGTNAATLGGQSNTASHNRSVVIGGTSLSTSKADEVVVPNLTVSGSAVNEVNAISIASNTGSMDCSSSNFFTLELVAAADTHLDVTNIQAGQTINLKVSQPSGGSGTISFAPELEFEGGTPFAATAAANAVDVMTFISFDGTTLQATGLKNFS